MTTVTKCIAVSTPFGNMYLTKHNDFDTYHASVEDSKSCYIVDKLCTSGLHIVEECSGWIAAYNRYTSELVTYLPIVSNYGDQFPQ